MKRVVVLTLLLIILTSCTYTGEVTKQRTIRIGVLAPLTGVVAYCGEDMTIGFESALEEIKKDYPNVNVDLIYEDTQFSPRITVTAAQKLINEDNVKVILGACSSSSTLAVAPIAEDNKIILFSPISFGEKITEAGDYVFRTAPTPKEMAPIIADFIYNDLGYKEVGMIYLNNEYGVTFSNRFKIEYEKLGGKILVNEGSEEDETDFKTTLLKMKDKNVKLVFMPHTSRPASLFVRQAHEFGMNFIYVAPNILEREHFWEAVGELGEGMYTASLIGHSSEKPEKGSEKERFVNQLKEKFQNKMISTERANSYDALRLLAKIMVEHCGESPGCIKEELYKVKDYEGAVGTFSIDKNGDAAHEEIFINVRKNDTLVLYK